MLSKFLKKLFGKQINELLKEKNATKIETVPLNAYVYGSSNSIIVSGEVLIKSDTEITIDFKPDITDLDTIAKEVGSNIKTRVEKNRDMSSAIFEEHSLEAFYLGTEKNVITLVFVPLN